jgi:hypothetical protein
MQNNVTPVAQSVGPDGRAVRTGCQVCNPQELKGLFEFRLVFDSEPARWSDALRLDIRRDPFVPMSVRINPGHDHLCVADALRELANLIEEYGYEHQMRCGNCYGPVKVAANPLGPCDTCGADPSHRLRAEEIHQQGRQS